MSVAVEAESLDPAQIWDVQLHPADNDAVDSIFHGGNIVLMHFVWQ
jgi:hypothetical protein